MQNLDRINEEYLNELKSENSSNKKIKLNIDNLNIDSFCMNVNSDELESLQDVFYRDRQKKLQKYFWMYEHEHNANTKIKEIKEYTENYLAMTGEVIKYFF